MPQLSNNMVHGMGRCVSTCARWPERGATRTNNIVSFGVSQPSTNSFGYNSALSWCPKVRTTRALRVDAP